MGGGGSEDDSFSRVPKQNHHVCLVPKNKQKNKHILLGIADSSNFVSHDQGNPASLHGRQTPWPLSLPTHRPLDFLLLTHGPLLSGLLSSGRPTLPRSLFVLLLRKGLLLLLLCEAEERERHEEDDEDAAESVRDREERVRWRADVSIRGRACALGSQRRLLYRHCESRIQSRPLREDVSLLLLRSVSCNRLSI